MRSRPTWRTTQATIAERPPLEACRSQEPDDQVPATPEGSGDSRNSSARGSASTSPALLTRDVSTGSGRVHGGLETLAAHGGDLTRIASVASMFVSRMDVLWTRCWRRAPGLAAPERPGFLTLMGKVAVANAQLAYQIGRALSRPALARACCARRHVRSAFCGRARAPRIHA